MDKFGFDDPQASAIVAYRLGQLAGLEIEKILNSDYEVHNARLQRCTDDYGIYLKPINLILKTGTN